jgi:hypothetical protein
MGEREEGMKKGGRDRLKEGGGKERSVAQFNSKSVAINLVQILNERLPHFRWKRSQKKQKQKQRIRRH